MSPMRTKLLPRWATLAGFAVLWSCGDGDSAKSTLAASAGSAGALPGSSAGAGNAQAGKDTGGSSGQAGAAAGSAGTGSAGASGNVAAAGSSSPVPCGDHECGDGQSCLRQLCVADCGMPANVVAVQTALAEGVEPIGQICRSVGVVDTADDPNDDRPVGISVAATANASSTVLAVERWPIDVQEPYPTVELVGQHTVFSTQWVYPSAFAMSLGSGSPVLIGYTTSESGYPGKILMIGDTAAASLEASANHDMVRVGENQWLLTTSELPAGAGAGLYWVTLSNAQFRATLVATGLGLFAGSVAISSDALWALVGGFSTNGHSIHALPMAALEQVVAGASLPIDVAVAADVATVAAHSSFGMLSDGRLLLRTPLAASRGLSIDVVVAEVRDGQLLLSNQRHIASAATLRDALPAKSDVLLVWDSWMTLVSPGQ